MSLTPITLKAFALQRARDQLADSPDLRATLAALPEDVIRELLRVDSPLGLLAEAELRYSYTPGGRVEAFLTEVGRPSCWFALYCNHCSWDVEHCPWVDEPAAWTKRAEARTSSWARLRLLFSVNDLHPLERYFLVSCELRPGSRVPELATAAVSHDFDLLAASPGLFRLDYMSWRDVDTMWLAPCGDSTTAWRRGAGCGRWYRRGAGEPSYAWPPRSPAQEQLAAAQAERWGPGAEAASTWVERETK